MPMSTTIEGGTMLERLRSVVRGEQTLAPIADLVGFRLTEIGQGRATVELQVGPQHANPLGTMHGVCCAISPMRRWDWHGRADWLAARLSRRLS